MKVNPLQFFRQVRQETKKITWPTRKEVTQVTTVVLAIVCIAALFFFVVDLVLAWGVKLVLGLGV